MKTRLIFPFMFVLIFFSSCTKTSLHQELSKDPNQEYVRWEFSQAKVLDVLQNQDLTMDRNLLENDLNQLYKGTFFQFDPYYIDPVPESTKDSIFPIEDGNVSTNRYSVGGVRKVVFYSFFPQKTIKIKSNELNFTQRFEYQTSTEKIVFVGRLTYRKYQEK